MHGTETKYFETSSNFSTYLTVECFYYIHYAPIYVKNYVLNLFLIFQNMKMNIQNGVIMQTQTARKSINVLL